MELTKQNKPLNKGCQYGVDLLSQSISELGLARSIVVDKNNVIINGDKVYQVAKQLGIKKAAIIETTGDTLVIVKRIDIDATSKAGLELSLVDNLCAKEGIVWDSNTIIKKTRDNVAFNPKKWGGDECVIQELDIKQLLINNTTTTSQKVEKQFIVDKQLSLFDLDDN